MERSKVLSEVIAEMERREKVGIKKYKKTLDRDDLSEEQFEQHLMEELMDGILYLKKKSLMRVEREKLGKV